MSDDRSPETGEASVDDAVLERAADRADVDAQTVADALIVLHASLIDSHSEFESEHDYVTVDGTRAYRVPATVWEDLSAEFEFRDEVTAAAEFAHTEQARLMFGDAIGVDERFEEGERGVVVSIDTAEEF
jgi:hypothetical protein